SNPYLVGPEPTLESLQKLGPFEVGTYTVPASSVTGFGGGVIYYPVNTDKKFPGIVMAPGYTADASSLDWLGKHLASHGFVVFVLNHLSKTDDADAVADELAAGLEYLKTKSPAEVQARLDASRMGVAGHSMGGGGTLILAERDPSLKAAVPLTPWHTDKKFNTKVPVLIIGAEADTVAPVSQHALPFFENLPKDTPKIYAVLCNASHIAPNSNNAAIKIYTVSWFKLFLCDDTRYRKFLCNVNDPALCDFKSNNLFCS
uniref:Leaf-branch compost cutinase n=1 Tax=Unknown prokaryotic organism TaxID=2725 RepID=A0ABD6GMS6_UNKP